jgi:hypothetical protein
MKFISIIFISLLHYFLGQRSEIKCVIKPDTGINSIILDKSNLENVIQDFGKAKIDRKWKKGIELQFIGQFVNSIKYIDQGLTFTDSGNDRHILGKNGIVSEITIDSFCNCKTEEGIGIGSSFKDVKVAFGQPLFPADTRDKNYEPIMWIEQDGNAKYLYVKHKNILMKFSSLNTEEAKIVRIKMY